LVPLSGLRRLQRVDVDYHHQFADTLKTAVMSDHCEEAEERYNCCVHEREDEDDAYKR
jgi:hypothetical protein